MKVIKEPIDKIQTLDFKCSYCGAEFEADMGEYKINNFFEILAEIDCPFCKSKIKHFIKSEI